MTHHGGKLSFSKEDLLSYLRTLLRIRVSKVGMSEKLPQPYVNLVDFVVPAFFSVYLECVGIARDNGLGIEVVPVWEVDPADPWMDIDAFQNVSRFLRLLGKFGFEFSTSLPRSRDGSWDLMTMQVEGSEIVHHNGNAHSVYALLSSLHVNNVVRTVLLPRVSYGNTERFNGLVRSLARFK